MKKRYIPALLTAAAVSMMLTGCLGKSAGGNLTKQGSAALEANDYSSALSDFQKAIKSGEPAVPAYRGEGIARMAMAEYADAVTSFENALSYTDEKMPETIRDIRTYMAAAQYRGGDYAGAISTCEQLLEAEDVTDAYYYRGASYLQLGQEDEARADFDQAAALAPNDYSLYLQIYERYKEKDLTAIGDEYLQTALGITPSTVEDQYNIGRIYYHLEQYDEAKTALSSAVEESYGPAMELMGEIYLAQQDYAHATALYQSIMDQSGESAAAYNGLALCSIAAGEYDTALNYIQTGLALGEGDGTKQLLYNEIVVYERKLDFATAKAKAESYIEKYPSDTAGQKEYAFLSTR